MYMKIFLFGDRVPLKAVPLILGSSLNEGDLIIKTPSVYETYKIRLPQYSINEVAPADEATSVNSVLFGRTAPSNIFHLYEKPI